jgi:hypothetical protein
MKLTNESMRCRPVHLDRFLANWGSYESEEKPSSEKANGDAKREHGMTKRTAGKISPRFICGFSLD